MEKALELLDELARDRVVRLSALACLPVLWFALAWGDARLLALVPLLALPAILARRLRRDQAEPEQLL